MPAENTTEPDQPETAEAAAHHDEPMTDALLEMMIASLLGLANEENEEAYVGMSFLVNGAHVSGVVVPRRVWLEGATAEGLGNAPGTREAILRAAGENWDRWDEETTAHIEAGGRAKLRRYIHLRDAVVLMGASHSKSSFMRLDLESVDAWSFGVANVGQGFAQGLQIQEPTDG